MDWFFDGLGTFLVGLLLGGGAGTAVTWNIKSRRTNQAQRAGDFAQQLQVSNDLRKDM